MNSHNMVSKCQVRPSFLCMAGQNCNGHQLQPLVSHRNVIFAVDDFKNLYKVSKKLQYYNLTATRL